MRRSATPFLLLLLLAALLALPQVLPRFHTYVASIVLLTALLATSLNLAIGYTGLYQFGHAVFYGVGAYGTALVLTRSGMPAPVAFLVGPLAAAALSLAMGLICIRLSKLYFGMLQISLGSCSRERRSADFPPTSSAGGGSPAPSRW
jgi:branched-chain amino acid transport system permease protein